MQFHIVKKIIIILVVLSSVQLSAQDISIFFLRDGSIVQGQVVNENQNRIFLKTEQGTIKILPSNILGREDSARKGDLTFISERIEYLQGNVNHLTGQVNHWNDSLRTALNDLYELFKNLEVLQNEFEIDLLRLHSQGREHKKKIEYVQDDLINQRVDIAANRQDMGGIDDTVMSLNENFSQVKQKLDNTANQSFLLSGNLSSIKNDIKSIRTKQDNQQNQIDMMAGALANNIQEVIRVQGQFSNVEEGIESNQTSISRLNSNLNEKTEELFNIINLMKSDLINSIDVVSTRIDDIEKNASGARKKLATEIGDLSNELSIISDKVNTLSRDMRKNQEKIDMITDDIGSMNKSMKRIEGKVTKVGDSVSKLQNQVDDIPIPNK